MTATEVMAMFERLNTAGAADMSVDDTCAGFAGFAGWLAGAWDRLPAQDIALLTAVGSVLWRGRVCLAAEMKKPSAGLGSRCGI